MAALTNRAPTPATDGDDIEVPEIDWNSWPGEPEVGVGVFPARMFTPGAVTSGLMMSALSRFGPRDENAAIDGASIVV